MFWAYNNTILNNGENHMTTPLNFKKMTNAQIVSAIEGVIEKFNLVNFYYKSNNSTDDTLLEVLPIGLVYNANNGGLQILALKKLGNEFQMRRYNLANTTRFSVAVRQSPAYKYADWKEAINGKDSYFPNEFSTGNALTEIDWSVWESEVAPAPVAPAAFNAQCACDCGDEQYELFSLPSNPGSYFLKSGDYTYFMSKKTVSCLMSFDLPRAAKVKVVMEPLIAFADVSEGMVVGINAPEDSDWEKLALTIVEKDADTETVNLIGIDKEKNVYRMVNIPVSFLKPRGKKAKVIGGCGSQVSSSSGWD